MFDEKAIAELRVSRKNHREDTVVHIGDFKIGGGNFQLIAGPCSVESEKQIGLIAAVLKKNNISLLRGGAFKPRTSPYSFQGLGEEGLRYLKQIKKETGLAVVSEIMGISQLPYFDDVDVLQVGSRNMQNYELLKELGALKKPILLKRGLSSTIYDFLLSAEYLLAGGNNQVILCERGIRTFETATRNTLDIAAVPLLKELTHLPIIVDPSHGTGISSLVPPMALASAVAGADGVMIEVHNNPKEALSDGSQSLDFDQFEALAASLLGIMPFCYRRTF